MIGNKQTPKEAARGALLRVLARLGAGSLDELDHKMLVVAVEHARDAVERIEETKRPRRQRPEMPAIIFRAAQQRPDTRGRLSRSEVPTEEDPR